MGAAALPMGMMGAGTGMGIAGNILEGQNAMKVANEQASALRTNARYVKENAIQAASIQSERGQNLLSSQKAGYAASGIRANSDVVGVVQQKTIADITKDIGFTLQRGWNEASSLGQQARDAIAAGKFARQQSDFNAVGAGLSGGSKMAYMGYEGGMLNSGGNSGDSGGNSGGGLPEQDAFDWGNNASWND